MFVNISFNGLLSLYNSRYASLVLL